jgi:hypothetical protein
MQTFRVFEDKFTSASEQETKVFFRFPANAAGASYLLTVAALVTVY